MCLSGCVDTPVIHPLALFSLFDHLFCYFVLGLLPPSFLIWEPRILPCELYRSCGTHLCVCLHACLCRCLCVAVLVSARVPVRVYLRFHVMHSSKSEKKGGSTFAATFSVRKKKQGRIGRFSSRFIFLFLSQANTCVFSAAQIRYFQDDSINGVSEKNEKKNVTQKKRGKRKCRSLYYRVQRPYSCQMLHTAEL